MPRADLIVTNVGELVTMDGPPRARGGAEARDIGAVRDAAFAVREGRFVWRGTAREAARWEAAETLDAGGRAVLPGLVDPHTHLVFAGSREGEIKLKLEGKGYLEILAAGGGIQSTVRATRKASTEELARLAGERAATMLAHGVTTLEAKTGYGLTVDEELRLLDVLAETGRRVEAAIVPTFLPLHAVPPEREGRGAEYARECAAAVPRAAERGARFVDAFVETGVFTADEARPSLVAARAAGLGAKVHADEFTACGGAELAGEVGATSADHLLHASTKGLEAMARAGTVATLLPGTLLAARLEGEPPVEAMRRLGIPVALGTDFSPNSWILSLPLVAALACYRLGMTPAECVTAVTVNAAHAIGREAFAGRIAEGMPADFVVLDAPTHEWLCYRMGGRVAWAVARRGRVVVGPADESRYK